MAELRTQGMHSRYPPLCSAEDGATERSALDPDRAVQLHPFQRRSSATPTMKCMTRSSSSDVLLLLARLHWAVRSIVCRSVMSVSDSFIEFCGCATPPCRRCGPASELSNMQPSLETPSSPASRRKVLTAALGRTKIYVKNDSKYMLRVTARCRLSHRKRNNGAGRNRSDGELTPICF